jgi:hypothetical protein
MKHNSDPAAILDRALIGRIVERQIPRNPQIGTMQGLAVASRVSRSTIYRVTDGDPTVSSSTLARIEAALGLPHDTLITAGAHDLHGLVEIGVPGDVVAWVSKELSKSGGHTGTNVSASG